MTAADLATAGDIAALAREVRELRATVAALADRLPTTWMSLRAAAERLDVDPRTLTAMAARGEIVVRRAGRRVLVDASSLRGPTVDDVARAAREARTP
jgi:hypothetical protein